jgi:rubrerythrin
MRAAYRCLVCGYGAFLADEFGRCPMCGEHRWESDRRQGADVPLISIIKED